MLKATLKPETWCTCLIYRLCSSCGCSIDENWWFPKKWLPLPVHRPSGIQPVNVCSNVPLKNDITLDWTMEESPAMCSILQFTTQFHDHVPMNWFFYYQYLSVFPFVQWIAGLLCSFLRGRSLSWFNLRFHLGQLCNWMMTGLESDLNTLRKQFEPKLMLVPNGSPLPVFFVLGILIFFGGDLRYDSLIWCFHCSTHLQRSWSIEAVHCVKVRGVMVVVPVVLLACNMIFIPAVKKIGHVAPSTYLFCLSCTELLALQDHSGRYRWRKSLSSCLSGFLAALLDQIFFWIKRPHEDVRSEGETVGMQVP